jgi:xylulokinase
VPLIAGVDSSTQSTKVVLCDLDSGAVVATGSAPHPPTTPPRSEQDPRAWWDAFVAAFRAAIANANAAAADVRAISVAAQCHGLVALDADDRVIRPAKLWNDTTTAPEMQELLMLLPAEAWATRTGSVPTAAFTVSKVLWLKRHEPEHYDRVRRMLLPHDWLTFQLTGRHVTDRSEASGTGYYNAATGSYDQDILALIDDDRDWATVLPSVLGPSEAVGHITPAAAELLGLSADVVIGPGAGDQHASALGLGARTGDRVLSLGTSGVVFTVSPDPVHDTQGMVDGVADAAGGFLPLVSTLNSALVTDAFARILGVGHDELSRLALAAPAKDVPVLAAYLDGERKPNLPDAVGTLTGIRGDLSREQIARSAIEGVVFGLRRGAHHLDRVGAPMTGRLILTGGASTSASVESVAVGTAMQAAACVSEATVQSVRDAWAPPTTEAAEPVNAAASVENYERYLAAARWRGADRTA